MDARAELKELEELDALEAKASGSTSTPTRATWDETIAGLPITRLAMGAASPLIGAAQLGANVGDWINTKTGAEPMVGNFINQKLAELDRMKKRGMAYASMGDANAEPGHDVTGLLGSLAPAGFIAKNVASRLPDVAQKIGASGILARMGLGATQGSAIGASQPVTNAEPGESILPQTLTNTVVGGAAGGAVPLAIDTVKGAGKLLQPIFDLFRGEKGVENIVRSGHERGVGPGKLDELRDAALQAKQLVPGSQPTTAEAVAHLASGSPIQALQNITARTEGGPSILFGERELSNQAARQAALQSIAPGLTQESTLATREAAAKSMYPPALKQKVQSDPILQELFSRPSMGKAMARAADIAKDKGDAFIFGKNMPEQQVASPILSSSGQPFTQTIPAQIAKYPVQSLHYIKLALDDMVKNPERFAIGKTEERGILGIKDELMDWAKTKAPDYIKARDVFSILSGPHNRTQVRDALMDKMQSATGMETPGTLVKAVDESAQMLKKSTGNARYKTIEDVLLPHEAQVARNVAADAERKLLSLHPVQPTQLKTSGDIATENMPKFSILSRPVVVANAILSHLGKTSIEPKVDALNAQLLLNPKMFGQFHTQQIPSRYRPMLDALLQQLPAAAATGATRNF